MRAPAVAFAAILLSVNAFAGNVPSCGRLWSESATHAAPNHNSGIKAADYHFEHTRTLSSYFFFLGSSFQSRVNTLAPGSRTIDLGGGLGIAHLQLVQEKGTSSTVINLQDFPALWHSAKARLEAHGTDAIRIGHLHKPGEYFPDTFWIESIGGLSRADVATVGNMFYFDLPRALEKARTVKSFSVEEVRDTSLEIIQNFEATAANKNWRYVTDSVEGVLPRLRDSADLVTDVFGAFYYSPGRVELLRQVDGALKKGGTAYFSIVGFLERGITDRVITREGREMDLFDYLLEKHPQHFRIEGETTPGKLKEQPAALIFSKQDRPLELRLREIGELEPFQNGDMVVPRRLYREE